MESDKTILHKALDTLARAMDEGIHIRLGGDPAYFDACSAQLNGIPLHYATFEFNDKGDTYVVYKGMHHLLQLERRIEVPFVELMNKTVKD